MELRPMTAADPKMTGRGEIHMCSAGIPGGAAAAQRLQI